jgi:beta-N-acetylhexosaminidase
MSTKRTVPTHHEVAIRVVGVIADRSHPRGRAGFTRLAALLATALTVMCAGCGPGADPGSSAADPRPSQAAGPVASAAARVPPASPSAAEPATAAPLSCAQRVDARLTEPQRVGQLFLAGLTADAVGSATEAALARYHFGSLLLATDTSEGAAAVSAATAHIQSLATPATTGGARFFIAANQEGGTVQALKGSGFSAMPSALTQGSWPVSGLRLQAASWGRELRAAGVNLDLAPVMDVVPKATADSNAPVGQLEREFGYSPDVTGPHGAAFIEGMASAGVATTAKHFPGLGRVAGNTDYTSDVVDTVTTADDPYLGSFRTAISAGAPFVMVALATYTRIDSGHLAVFSPAIMTLLRARLGFRGVIISDDLGDAAAVANMPAADRAIEFIEAGGDMITTQSLAPAEVMAQAVLARAAASPLFRAKVDTAALRVLSAKQAYGLLPC